MGDGVAIDVGEGEGVFVGVGATAGVAVGVGGTVEVGDCVGVSVDGSKDTFTTTRVGSGVGVRVGATVGIGVGAIVGTGSAVTVGVAATAGDGAEAGVGGLSEHDATTANDAARATVMAAKVMRGMLVLSICGCGDGASHAAFTWLRKPVRMWLLSQ